MTMQFVVGATPDSDRDIMSKVTTLYRAGGMHHTQFSAYDSTARFDASGNQINGQFGQFTAARDPRLIQLSVRVQF